MNYEVKNVVFNDKPFVKNETTMTQHISVFTGVVGNPHEMVIRDFASIDFSNTGLDAQEIIALINAGAVAFSAEKYPNT